HGGTDKSGVAPTPTVGRAADRWSAASRTAASLYLPCPIFPSGWALAGVSGIGSSDGQGAAGTVGCGAWPSSRPASTWQVNALDSCMLTLGSAKSAVRSLALEPTISPA